MVSSTVEKVKQAQLRQRQKDLKENRFWLNRLRQIYWHEQGFEALLGFERMVAGLTAADVQKAAGRYFRDDVAHFILMPEEE